MPIMTHKFWGHVQIGWNKIIKDKCLHLIKSIPGKLMVALKSGMIASNIGIFIKQIFFMSSNKSVHMLILPLEIIYKIK